MYRAGRLRRVFRARGKARWHQRLRGHKGYVQIRVVGFPWETASLEAACGARTARCSSAESGRKLACGCTVGASSSQCTSSDRYAIRTRNLNRTGI